MTRLFFAVWPDPAAASRLASAAEEIAMLTGGRPVPLPKIHLTLAFLGDVADDRLPVALESARGLDHSPFQVVLDRWGSFRGARVAWAGCRESSAALLNLNADLTQRLRTAGFVLEDRAYVPHVTLARKIGRALESRDAEPVAWTATEVTLVRTEFGKGSYETLARWELGGSGPGPSSRLRRPG